jgi:hypothetical protein
MVCNEKDKYTNINKKNQNLDYFEELRIWQIKRKKNKLCHLFSSFRSVKVAFWFQRIYLTFFNFLELIQN